MERAIDGAQIVGGRGERAAVGLGSWLLSSQQAIL